MRAVIALKFEDYTPVWRESRGGGGGESSSSIEDDLALDASKAERQKRDIHECNEF